MDEISLLQRRDQSFPAALVTPSASPPVLRSLFSPERSGKPAAKRQRLESTPSSLSVSTPSSSLSVDKQQLCDEARRASSIRLLNTWSQLAQRYARPLDEDDIIDLRDGELIKDRGVLRAVPKNYRIGHLLDSEDPLSDVNDASSDGGALTEGEDDIDELDSFAYSDDPDLSGDIERERQRQERVPPVRQRDPMDAQDLEEFLEAEKIRKEIYGEEEEEEEEEVVVEAGQYDKEEILSRRGSGGEADTLKEWLNDFGDVEERGQTDVGDSDDLKFPSKSRQDATDSSDSGVRRVRAERALTPNTDDSEDELATWVIDESAPPKSETPSRTVVDRSSPARAKTPRKTPSRTMVADNIIDLTESPPRSPLATRRRNSSQPPRCSPVRARSKSITRAKSMTKSMTSSTLKKANISSVMQLYTPPLSSSSVGASTPGPSSTSNSRPSHPAQRSPALSRPRLEPMPRYASVMQSATKNVTSTSNRPLSPLPTLDLSKMLCISTKSRGPIPKPRPIPRIINKPRYKAEVVITPMSKLRTSMRQTPSSPVKPPAQQLWSDDHVNDLPAPTTTATPQPWKAKGKSKELPCVVDSSTPSVVTRSSSRKYVVPILKKMKTPDAEDDEHNVAPTRPQKRKRIISSSSVSDHFTPTAGPSTVPFPIKNKKGLREIEWPSSSSPTKSPDSSDDEYKNIRKPKLNSQSRFDIPLESHHAMYPYPLPYTPLHDHGRTQFPSLPMAPVQDPRAQFVIAQAMHQLSYLMTTGAPPGHQYPPAYPYIPRAMHWPPQTPNRDRGLLESSSPSGGPGSSSPSSVYAPFMHPYPYSFDTRYSDASLPPSSPPASSPPTSPIIRASSMARGRSKSRGRRVSFRLDANDKQLPLVDQQQVVVDEDEIGVETSGSSKPHGGTEVVSDTLSRGRSARRNVSLSNTKRSRSGIAVSNSGSEDYGVQIRSSRERARTPGPPSRAKHTL